MSFYQGLSGLNAQAKYLDVIGNNIANVSTVGFKGSRIEFGDIYAAAVGGGNNLQAGLGVRIGGIFQQFGQGNITVTNNPLDVAISGSGFFRLEGENGITYSRNGQFKIDKEGYLVSSTGQNVTGYTELVLDQNLEVVSAGTLGKVKVDLDAINATPTSELSMVLNLNAGSTTPTVSPFDATDPDSYNYSTSVTVYDSLGNDHSLSYYFVNTGTNTWDVYAYLDGTSSQMDLGGADGQHTLTFNTSGILVGGASVTNTAFPITGAADLQVTMDFTGSTQYTGSSGVNSLSQNGYPSGTLTGTYIDDSGILYGRYSNGVTKPQQQLLLATFRNDQGLTPIGDNQWVGTVAAGSETINRPGEGVAGVLQASSVEESNVDLTAELVNMIVAQRTYQANSQTIKTQDQILNTLVNLR